MEFKIEEKGKDIKVVLINEEKEIAKATCYFENTPIVENKNIGCIGEFETEDKEAGAKILNKCEEILKEKNVSLIVAPMNGNTWKKYRTMKYTNGDDLFLLENVNPMEHNEILKEAGFEEIDTYTSTKGFIKDAYKSEALDLAEENLKNENITIRNFNKENYIEDLKKIFNVSKQSFTRNPFYTPIEEEDFLKQYEQYVTMCDEELILIAEKDGEEVGFVFCVPNFNEAKEGKKIETLILKTIAVLPEYEYLAIGNVLLNRISKVAENKGFLKWIFAFMYSNNTSQKMAKRNGTEVIREYALYGKKLKQ